MHVKPRSGLFSLLLFSQIGYGSAFKFESDVPDGIAMQPNPCLPNESSIPQYHITNMGIGPHDANAIFYRQGVWHVFHQANWTDWAHLVSSDLARWTRLPSALFPNGDWDGSLSLLDGEPVIMFDCYNIVDCLPPNSTMGDTEVDPNHKFEVGDPPHIGVAHPKNLSDPNLTDWYKSSRNPIVINAGTITRGYAGPSNLWQDSVGKINMAMTVGHTVARLVAEDHTLHNWSIANPTFLHSGGNNGHGATGLMFFPIAPSTAPLTHMLGGVWSDGDPNYQVGCPWFVLGKYNDAAGTFTNVTQAQPLDSGLSVIWSTVGHVEDGRLLFIGWFNFGVGCLTTPREVTFDSAQQKLLVNPVNELISLRGHELAKLTNVSVSERDVTSLIDPRQSNTAAFDMESIIMLPTSGVAILHVAILAASPESAGIIANISVSSPNSNGRMVNVSVGAPGGPKELNATTSFTLPARSRSTLALRILADKSVVELFAGNGRGVVTTGMPDTSRIPEHFGVFLSAIRGAIKVSSTAWSMGCGWARYP